MWGHLCMQVCVQAISSGVLSGVVKNQINSTNGEGKIKKSIQSSPSHSFSLMFWYAYTDFLYFAWKTKYLEKHEVLDLISMQAWELIWNKKEKTTTLKSNQCFLFSFCTANFFSQRTILSMESQFHCQGNLRFHRQFPCLNMLFTITITCSAYFKDTSTSIKCKQSHAGAQPSI